MEPWRVDLVGPSGQGRVRLPDVQPGPVVAIDVDRQFGPGPAAEDRPNVIAEQGQQRREELHRLG